MTNELKVKDFEFNHETDEPVVRYELKLVLVDPDGYYNGVMNSKDVVNNLRQPLLQSYDNEEESLKERLIKIKKRTLKQGLEFWIMTRP